MTIFLDKVNKVEISRVTACWRKIQMRHARCLASGESVCYRTPYATPYVMIHSTVTISIYSVHEYEFYTFSGARPRDPAAWRIGISSTKLGDSEKFSQCTNFKIKAIFLPVRDEKLRQFIDTGTYLHADCSVPACMTQYDVAEASTASSVPCCILIIANRSVYIFDHIMYEYIHVRMVKHPISRAIYSTKYRKQHATRKSS